jgi:hypothetical protein
MEGEQFIVERSLNKLIVERSLNKLIVESGKLRMDSGQFIVDS